MALCGTEFEFLNFIYIRVLFTSLLNCVRFVVAICGSLHKYLPQRTKDLLRTRFVILTFFGFQGLRYVFPNTFIFSTIMY